MSTVLLLIDIQNDYFAGGSMELSNAECAAENAARVLKHFRKENLPVIHIQHEAINPEATFFIPNTQGVEFYSTIIPLKGEAVILKNFPNSFRETSLLQKLQGLGITKIVICGMMTQMCVDATVRAAKDLGFDCIIIGDACATRDMEIFGKVIMAEAVQNAFLAALNYYYAEVTDAKNYLE